MQAKPTALKVLDIASILVLAISTYLALFFAPTELVMGAVQRVFYFHIGTAWVGLLGFILAAGSGIIYLITKDMKWDLKLLIRIYLPRPYIALSTSF